MVRVQQVDGAVWVIAPSQWGAVPRDGVDTIDAITDAGETRIQGHSFYWCYPDGAAWVFGGCSPYQHAPSTEVVCHPDGRQVGRPVTLGLPDLTQADIKLGWWRVGEARPS